MPSIEVALIFSIIIPVFELFFELLRYTSSS